MSYFHELLAEIARQELSIDCLEERGSDNLDFHTVSVWNLEKALEAAFRAGIVHAQQNKERI